MKERPILFSAPMVRALLDDTKTQTRRAFSAKLCHLMMDAASIGEVSDFLSSGVLEPGDLAYTAQFCPYGAPGDRLWVKETFMPMPHLNAKAFYRTTDGLVGGKWKPSIFMPRALSRITLEITDVRVQRLNDISEADAKAEGVDEPIPLDDISNEEFYRSATFGPYQDAYRALWNTINGSGSWALNPWVWVIEFTKIPAQV